MTTNEEVPEDVLDKKLYLIHNGPDITLEELITNVEYQRVLVKANAAMAPIIEEINERCAGKLVGTEVYRRIAQEKLKELLPDDFDAKYQVFSFIFPLYWPKL